MGVQRKQFLLACQWIRNLTKSLVLDFCKFRRTVTKIYNIELINKRIEDLKKLIIEKIGNDKFINDERFIENKINNRIKVDRIYKNSFINQN